MATDPTSKNNGFEWRILLGPTRDWPTPTPELDTAGPQITSPECCELCREPIGDGKPFITNFAGERPIHIACSVGDEPTADVRRPGRRTWRSLLQNFVSG
jgi:hypothetical protein